MYFSHCGDGTTRFDCHPRAHTLDLVWFSFSLPWSQTSIFPFICLPLKDAILHRAQDELLLDLVPFSFSSQAFGRNECPDPGIPLNARRFGDSFQLGSSISVVCEEGFIKTQGADTITCHLEEGKVMWSGLIPKCEGTNCWKRKAWQVFVWWERRHRSKQKAAVRAQLWMLCGPEPGGLLAFVQVWPCVYSHLLSSVCFMWTKTIFALLVSAGLFFTTFKGALMGKRAKTSSSGWVREALVFYGQHSSNEEFLFDQTNLVYCWKWSFY